MASNKPARHLNSVSPEEFRNAVVWFYLPEQQALGDVDPLTLDPDRDWRFFGTGVYVWILQTFLRLRDAGAPVGLVERPPAAGLVVAHADNIKRLFAEAPAPRNLTVVAAQSDKGRQLLADFSVVQNAAAARDDDFFIPSWLQPGLIPRSPGRGARVENAAYVGAIKELHPELAGPDWIAVLRGRGLHWERRTVAFSGSDRLYSDAGWNDYSNIDVLVALRSPGSWNARPKPAAKLQNAWAAGVPAVLSPEIPYRELRRSRLDFFEARSSADVLAAIETLRRDPILYSEMVQNGLERAKQFQPDRLVDRWIHVLWEEIAPRSKKTSYRLMAKARRYRALARRFHFSRLAQSTGPASQ
jgi:hypothetical protein